MVLKYHISPYPALLQNMVARIWEAESDGVGAHVFEEVIPERDGAGVPTVGAGHQVPYTVTANGLDRVVHIVRLYTASGALLHEYNAEPKVDIVTIFDPIRFKIGDGQLYTPLEGTSLYTNPVLAGLTEKEYNVFRNGYGYLFPGEHIDVDMDSSSWTLKQDGDVFGAGEEFLIQRKPSVISSVINDSVVGKLFGGFVDIAADRDYLATDLRKLLRFAGTCSFTFPALGAIPIGYLFAFNNFDGGAGSVGTINFLNAPLKWKGEVKTSFQINDYCEAAFAFDGANWNVVWINQSAATDGSVGAAGDVMGVGELEIGDVGIANNPDPYWPVTHNKNITGDYSVFISIKSNDGVPNFIRNNLICGCWWHDSDAAQKKNRFYVSLQEVAKEIQNIKLAWLIIKL